MNYEMSKSDIQGKEGVTLKIWPSDNLEREYFNTLFTGAATFEVSANKDIVTIKPIRNATTPGIKDSELQREPGYEFPES